MDREDSAADKLPPPEPLDVVIGPQDAVTPAGAISAVIEGIIVVQVSFDASSARGAEALITVSSHVTPMWHSHHDHTHPMKAKMVS